MSRSLANNNTCPCCRAVLREIPAQQGEGDDEDGSDYEGEEDDDADSESGSESDFDFPEDNNVMKIHNAFLAKGYSSIDYVTILLGRVNERNDKYTPQFLKQMFDDFNKIVADLDSEKAESELFAAEDVRLP